MGWTRSPTARAGGANAEVFDEMMATGAVITGRRTFDYAGGWAGDHHDGVPVVRADPLRSPTNPRRGMRATSPTSSPVREAKAAAGGRDVMMHGARAAQSCLRAGLLDELELHLVPVLLGQGRRLFDDLPPDHVELELVRAWRAGSAAPALPRAVGGLSDGRPSAWT